MMAPVFVPNELWVKITDYKNGAYPLIEKGGYLTGENSVLLQKNIGQAVPVIEHGNNFYITTQNCSRKFLICKKDCIVLQQ